MMSRVDTAANDTDTMVQRTVKRDEELLPEHWATVMATALADRLHGRGIYHQLSREAFWQHMTVLFDHFEETRR